MSISFLYKNLIDNVTSISENTSQLGWGTAYLYDGDLNSAFRGTSTVTGTTTVLFNFGSAVYMDSVVCINNLTSTGTCWLLGGTIASVGDFTTGIPIDGLGTSYKYFGNQGFQYWKFNMKGATAISQHQVNELFLGKRTTISEMPSYPFSETIEESTIDLISEKGNKWVYQNYERKIWSFNFEGVNATTENALYKMYKYCRKNTQPLWMLLDPDNDPLNIKFVRFQSNAFLSEEITKNIFDITMGLEQEI